LGRVRTPGDQSLFRYIKAAQPFKLFGPPFPETKANGDCALSRGAPLAHLVATQGGRDWGAVVGPTDGQGCRFKNDLLPAPEGGFRLQDFACSAPIWSKTNCSDCRQWRNRAEFFTKTSNGPVIVCPVRRSRFCSKIAHRPFSAIPSPPALNDSRYAWFY
jgi:hypothetical protein